MLRWYPSPLSPLELSQHPSTGVTHTQYTGENASESCSPHTTLTPALECYSYRNTGSLLGTMPCHRIRRSGRESDQFSSDAQEESDKKLYRYRERTASFRIGLSSRI